MVGANYSSVPGDESHVGTKSKQRTRDFFSASPTTFCICLCLLALALISFVAGLNVGQVWSHRHDSDGEERGDGLVDPQAFIGDIPKKNIKFRFPSGYEAIDENGDQIWDDLMPLGSGFVRVPHPRKYAMPRSTRIEKDAEDAELYSVSMTHQLHCLAVLRHVIVKYEKHDKSRFAGEGHEYHCLDYIRQSILCAGDTTLDHADIEYNADGSEREYGFTGANATHRCRDWDAIRRVLIDKRFDNKTGILF
ncbi:hypothetical protein BJ875DRAFT_85516 [Amylocarpus encephaloides]|uniref:Oxidase ustYa n=1 Tax=Amylocarpus encephaloides TaxID=45428 RepID=A0A9P7YTD6_9HELO|nr:hypothetical protein BJ875DRAFT_85516 [Amylocarpus encephaloides]